MWMVTCQEWRGTTKAQDVAATLSLLDGILEAHTCIQEGSYCPLKACDFPTPTNQRLKILGWRIHHAPDTDLHRLPPKF